MTRRANLASSHSQWLLSADEVRPAPIDTFLEAPLFAARTGRAGDGDIVLRHLARATADGTPILPALARLTAALPGAQGRSAARLEDAVRAGASIADAVRAQEDTFGPRAGAALEALGHVTDSADALAQLVRVRDNAAQHRLAAARQDSRRAAATALLAGLATLVAGLLAPALPSGAARLTVPTVAALAALAVLGPALPLVARAAATPRWIRHLLRPWTQTQGQDDTLTFHVLAALLRAGVHVRQAVTLTARTATGQHAEELAAVEGAAWAEGSLSAALATVPRLRDVAEQLASTSDTDAAAQVLDGAAAEAAHDSRWPVLAAATLTAVAWAAVLAECWVVAR